jgi:hypothetical protein
MTYNLLGIASRSLRSGQALAELGVGSRCARGRHPAKNAGFAMTDNLLGIASLRKDRSLAMTETLLGIASRSLRSGQARSLRSGQALAQNTRSE